MFDGIGAELVWDGTDSVRIPERMGSPSEGQMQGTTAEQLTELSGRVCYDDKTEILSENGWVTFKELSRGVRVATVEMATNRLEYQLPTDYIADPFDGELYAVDNTKVSIRVTHNHNMVVVDKTGLVLRRAVECAGTKYKLRRSALRTNAGFKPSWIQVPPRRYINNDVEREGPGLSIKVDTDWAWFLGYYISEGSINIQGKSGDTVSIYQNSNGMGPIIETIERCGFVPAGPYDDPRKDVQQIRIGSSALVRHLIEFGVGSKNKRLPDYVFEWSIELREALLDALMYGDGTVTEHGTRVYNTASEQLADDVQQLIVELGRNANINISQCETCTMYRVRETKHGDHTVNKHERQDRSELYTGTVYCVSVPNKTLVVRRNKKVYICGNCYDSLGSKRSRKSSDYFAHIMKVRHLSISEHYHATLLVEATDTGLIDDLAYLMLNRPWVWVTPLSETSARLTMDCRVAMEFDKWSAILADLMPDYPINEASHLGTLIRDCWHDLTPSLVKRPHPASVTVAAEQLNIGSVDVVEPETDAEKWITLYLYGSRGFTHELVRHGDFTGISQRSTRYCDESMGFWTIHPLIQQYIQEADPTTALIHDAENSAFIDQARHIYKTWVKRLIPFVKGRMDPSDPYAKSTARKQARGAARGFLGNALETEIIFSASVMQWRHIFRMRAAGAADGEARYAACRALEACKKSRYADRFQDMTLVEADDGTGHMLAGGGAA
jgi:thymidylate synthase ThyX